MYKRQGIKSIKSIKKYATVIIENKVARFYGSRCNCLQGPVEPMADGVSVRPTLALGMKGHVNTNEKSRYS